MAHNWAIYLIPNNVTTYTNHMKIIKNINTNSKLCLLNVIIPLVQNHNYIKHILDFSLAPCLILDKVHIVEQLLPLHVARHCQIYRICNGGRRYSLTLCTWSTYVWRLVDSHLSKNIAMASKSFTLFNLACTYIYRLSDI